MRSFKNLFIAILAFFAAANVASAADTYHFDPYHTAVTWQAGHFGFSRPTGKFIAVTGTLVLDEEKPENSTITATVDTNVVVTGIPKFDEHLKSADFFNTAKFPTATFTSKEVKVTGKNTAKVTGLLTLAGVSKTVVLDVTLNKIGDHPFSNRKTAGFSATTTLKRSEFGMSYGLPGVPDEVDILIEAEFGIE